MIVVLSMNTALDRVLLVPGFVPGGVNRTQHSAVFAGGKALNVARVVRELGEPVRVVGTLGSQAAPPVLASCRRLGIDARFIPTAAESRTCVIVVDPVSGQQTVVNEPGHAVLAAEVDAVSTRLDGSIARGDLLCLAGSLPPGVPDDFYAGVVRQMRERGVRVLIDASGEAFRLALRVRPWAAAPNAAEAAAALGLDAVPEVLAPALARQVEHAIVTLAEEGSMYAHRNSLWRVATPAVRTVNAVASGDAFVAGFLVGMTRGLPEHTALRLATACGAANAARFEPGIGEVAVVERLAAEVSIEPVRPSA